MGRRYSRREVVQISSRYLSRGDMALIVVASLKRPEAQRVNEGELDDRRRREGGT